MSGRAKRALFASAATALAALSVAGCAGVQSVVPNAPGDTSTGPVYQLALAMIDMRVRVDDGAGRVSVIIDQPRYVGDPNAAYALNAVWGPFNSDEAKFAIAPNGLLTSASLDSEGQLDETLVAAAKSAAAFLEGAVGTKEARNQLSSDRQVFGASLDLARLVDEEGALKALNARIAAAISGRHPDKVPTIHVERVVAFLDEAGDENVDLGDQRARRSKSGEAAKVNCNVGLCYRTLLTYRITTTFSDDSSQEAIVQIPNGAPTRSVAFRRGLFADWKTAATFENGFLKTYELTSGSEALAIAATPGEIIGGLAAGLAERAELLTARQNLAEKEIALAEANRERAEKLETKATRKAPAPLLVHFVGEPPDGLPKVDDNGAGALPPG